MYGTYSLLIPRLISSEFDALPRVLDDSQAVPSALFRDFGFAANWPTMRVTPICSFIL